MGAAAVGTSPAVKVLENGLRGSFARGARPGPRCLSGGWQRPMGARRPPVLRLTEALGRGVGRTYPYHAGRGAVSGDQDLRQHHGRKISAGCDRMEDESPAGRRALNLAVPFSAWLAGETPAAAKCTVKETRTALDGRTALASPDRPLRSIRPTTLFGLTGPGIARIVGPGPRGRLRFSCHRARGRTVSLSAPYREEALGTLLICYDERQSYVAHACSGCAGGLTTGAGGLRLRRAGNRACRDAAGPRVRCCHRGVGRREGGFALLPVPLLLGSDRKPFGLGLVHAVVATTYEDGHVSETVVIATAAGTPRWLHLVARAFWSGRRRMHAAFVLRANTAVRPSAAPGYRGGGLWVGRVRRRAEAAFAANHSGDDVVRPTKLGSETRTCGRRGWWRVVPRRGPPG